MIFQINENKLKILTIIVNYVTNLDIIVMFNKSNFDLSLQTKKQFPLIMGIVNVTPDSFSDGGKYFNTTDAADFAIELINDGADIIDIGGESTRPGAKSISEQEEIDRVIPVIEKIKKVYPQIPISVDTTKYNVAKYALMAGADIINDISGLTITPDLALLVSEFKAYIIIMHIKGTPQNMQINPYYDNIVIEVYDFLARQIEFAKKCGTDKIIIDVGIGFGKNYEHNLELLNNLDRFRSLNLPLLLGISRKSFIGKMLNIEKPEERDFATTIIHSLLNKKTDIIRVHNVKQSALLRIISNEIKF